jgi:hypothetical protein
MGGKVIARGVGLAVLAMAICVLLAFGWVWFYSMFVDPGHDGAFYQAYAQRVAPLISIAAGIPLLFLAGWLNARGTDHVFAPLVPAVAYIVIDVVLLAASGLWPAAWSVILSYLTKLASAWAGGALARRRRAGLYTEPLPSSR